MPLLPYGHIVAFEQFRLPLESKVISAPAPALPKVKLTQDKNMAKIAGNAFEVIFDKKTGFITSFLFQKTQLFKQAPEPSFWRAPTDNDFGNRMQERCSIWRKAGENRTLESLKVTQVNPGQVRVDLAFNLKDVPARYLASYIILGSGDVIIENQLIPQGENLPEIPRVGIKIALPAGFENVRWYGRGPQENYCDRKTAALIGVYNAKVGDMVIPYVSPQEYGQRTDVRWAAVSNSEGKGLLAVGLPLLEFSALPYTVEDLTQESRGSKHPFEIQKRDFVSLNLDFRQMGVGGDDSWGAKPHPQYLIPAQTYSWKLRLRPFTSSDDVIALSKSNLGI
jgi:beta-galactosidase